MGAQKMPVSALEFLIRLLVEGLDRGLLLHFTCDNQFGFGEELGGIVDRGRLGVVERREAVGKGLQILRSAHFEVVMIGPDEMAELPVDVVGARGGAVEHFGVGEVLEIGDAPPCCRSRWRF